MRQAFNVRRLYLNGHYLGDIKKVDGKPLFTPNEMADFRLDDIDFIRDELDSLSDDSDDIPF